jgi:hypothetical protein
VDVDWKCDPFSVSANIQECFQIQGKHTGGGILETCAPALPIYALLLLLRASGEE